MRFVFYDRIFLNNNQFEITQQLIRFLVKPLVPFKTLTWRFNFTLNKRLAISSWAQARLTLPYLKPVEIRQTQRSLKLHSVKNTLQVSDVLDWGFFFPLSMYNSNDVSATFKAAEHVPLPQVNPEKTVKGVAARLFFEKRRRVLRKRYNNSLCRFSGFSSTNKADIKLARVLKRVSGNTGGRNSKPLKSPIRQSSNFSTQRLLPSNWTKATFAPFATPKVAGWDCTQNLIQVRLRPGLSNIWRDCRALFVHHRRLKLFRQKRLTNYITLTRHVAGFNLIKLLTLSVGWVSKNSNLMYGDFFSGEASWNQIYRGRWFLNGRAVLNPFFQLYAGDVLILQKYTSDAPCISYSFSFNLNRKWKNWGWLAAWRRPDICKTPWYLEVDELTNTVTILTLPQKVSDFDPVTAQLAPFLTYRMYNWKYTT